MDRKIVVIEDEPELRQYATETLEAAGLDVAAFDDGETALAYVEADPDGVGAVFADVRVLGQTGGCKVAESIAASHPSIVVVVTCGSFAERSADLGPHVRYIGKPWVAIDVLNAIIDARQED